MANGVGILQLTVPIVTGADQPTGDITLPVLVISGSGSASQTEMFHIPMFSVYGDNLITARQISDYRYLPVPEITSSGTAPLVCSGSIVLPTLVVSGTRGVQGTAALVIPILEIGQFYHGSSSLISTLIEILGIGNITTTTFKGIVMNISNKAISTYSGFPMNSMAYFKGNYLGATSAGIYKLTGDLDNTSTIKANIKTGSLDLGENFLRHIRDIWLSHRTDGTIAIKIWVDEDDESEVEKRSKVMDDKIHDEKFNMPLGLKGRFYTIEYKNIDGSDFDLHRLSMIIDEIRRKIR